MAGEDGLGLEPGVASEAAWASAAEESDPAGITDSGQVSAVVLQMEAGPAVELAERYVAELDA